MENHGREKRVGFGKQNELTPIFPSTVEFARIAGSGEFDLDRVHRIISALFKWHALALEGTATLVVSAKYVFKGYDHLCPFHIDFASQSSWNDRH